MTKESHACITTLDQADYSVQFAGSPPLLLIGQDSKAQAFPQGNQGPSITSFATLCVCKWLDGKHSTAKIYLADLQQNFLFLNLKSSEHFCCFTKDNYCSSICSRPVSLFSLLTGTSFFFKMWGLKHFQQKMNLFLPPGWLLSLFYKGSSFTALTVRMGWSCLSILLWSK